MNVKLVVVSAAALFVAAPLAHAAPDRAVQAFLDDAVSQAQAQLGDLDLSQHPVRVRAYVGSDGRLNAVKVIESAGSREADYRLQTAVKQVRVHYVPPALIGARVNLAFGPTATQLAKAP